MLHDRARIQVRGGAGGNGAVSFRREAHVPRGGPDGGDGGRGGDVVMVCDDSRRDLSEMRYSRHYRAGRGGHGRGKNQHGARGTDEVVRVPPGTHVVGIDGDEHDLVEPGQRVVIASGGSGGHGNKRFASSTRQAPRFAERGLEGEEGWVELRLKLLADAGLVGLPNAGKSSLLAALTRASPKVGDYPFTTLEPVLGTVEADERQIVLADIPGLIAGAAGGAGLGHEFLAHVERCRALVHLLELGPAGGEGDPIAAIRSAYGTVRAELAEYGAGLEALSEIVVLSKRDLVSADELDRILAGCRDLADGPLLAVSAATGTGIEELGREIERVIGAGEPRRDPVTPQFEAEHRTYRPAAEQGFEVVPEDGSFRVAGRGIEVLVRRHDLSNPEALEYLEGRLREIGVLKALADAGFEPGDEVRIGEQAFDLWPS